MSKKNPRNASGAIAEIGWLSTTPTPFQAAVLAKADVLSFCKGAGLVQQGDEAGGLLGVLEGQIELHLQSTDGKGRTLALIAGQGFWFGDLTSILGRPRRIGANARTDCKMLRLSRAELARIVDADPVGWKSIAQLVALNHALALDTIDMLRRKDTTERVGLALLILLAVNPRADTLENLPHSDLGALTGLSRDSVGSALAAFEARGLISSSYASVKVVDSAGLYDLLWPGITG